MGGQIFIGIKHSNGQEHLFNAWTNYCPEVFSNLSFWNEGQELDLFLQEVAEMANEHNGYEAILDHIPNDSQYGYVLVDFQNKVYWSANGYFEPGNCTLYDGLSEKEIANVNQAITENRVKAIRHFSDPGKEIALAKFRQDWQAGEDKYSFYNFKLDLTPFKRFPDDLSAGCYSRSNNHDTHWVKELAEWLKEYKWQAEIK